MSTNISKPSELSSPKSDSKSKNKQGSHIKSTSVQSTRRMSLKPLGESDKVRAPQANSSLVSNTSRRRTISHSVSTKSSKDSAIVSDLAALAGVKSLRKSGQTKTTKTTKKKKSKKMSPMSDATYDSPREKLSNAEVDSFVEPSDVSENTPHSHRSEPLFDIDEAFKPRISEPMHFNQDQEDNRSHTEDQSKIASLDHEEGVDQVDYSNFFSGEDHSVSNLESGHVSMHDLRDHSHSSFVSNLNMSEILEESKVISRWERIQSVSC